MNSKQLSPKVAAAGVAGALTVVLVYVLGEVGIDIPTEVASAITTLIAAAAAYFKRDPLRDKAA